MPVKERWTVKLKKKKKKKSWKYIQYISIASLSALNQCKQPDPAPHIPVLQTRPTLMFLFSQQHHHVLWTQSESSKTLALQEHFSPSPWHHCASPWTPWVSSASHGAFQSSSRPGPGLSCIVNTVKMEKTPNEGSYSMKTTGFYGFIVVIK